MTDNENTVKPVSAITPVVMNRIRRIESLGAEERYPEYRQNKKVKKNPSKRDPNNECIVTSDKVDCKV